MTQDPMIQLQGVSRIFQVGDQPVHALDDVNLRIAAGEYVSVMGPSGSGKSTLLNIIGLLDRPTRGRYRLGGVDVTSMDDARQAQVRRRQIGFVFQFFQLLPRLTALENVELPMLLEGLPPAQRHRRARQALEAVGLVDRMQHRPDQLSGGQRQRVAIARATVMEPDVILADEPTGNLDRHAGGEVIAMLESLHARGMTLILVTHDLELGQRAGRSLRLLDGRIVSDSGAGGDALG